MTAAVLRSQGLPRPYATSQPMAIEQVDLDPPGPGKVLYQIIGVGLDHSDLSTIENLRPRKLPSIPDHEAAGIVAEVGPGVAVFKPGDHVVSVFVSSCGDCRYCNNGRPDLCSGSCMGSCAPQRDIPRFTSLYKRGKLPVQELRSGCIGSERINQGFDRLAERAMLRQVLQPHA